MKYLDFTGLQKLWAKIKTHIQTSLEGYAKKTELFSKNYNDLTHKPTIPTDYILITLSSASGTLTADQLTKLKANPHKVVFNYAGFYYFAENLSSTATWYYSCNVYYSGSSIVKRVITITTSSGAYSQSDYTYTPPSYTHPANHPASMITGLATVATSGSYNDLTDKPTALDTDGLATEDYVDEKVENHTHSIYLTVEDSLSLASKAYADAMADEIRSETVLQLQNYATKVSVDSINNKLPGKVDRSDLATVATSGSYNDLADQPTIPSYSTATTLASGLMSANDKTKLNYTNVAYGTCATAAATAAKVIVVSGNTKWALTNGAIIVVNFTYTNTSTAPTFNVNNTGAKSVYYNSTKIASSTYAQYAGYTNRYCTYVYNGTGFVFLGWSYDANTTYTNASLGQGYAICGTAAATTAKVATLSSYALVLGGIVAVRFTYAVPASATLNINSKGAKAIYHKGSAIQAGVINAGDIATFIYGGGYYQLLAIDTMSSGSASGGTTTNGSYSEGLALDLDQAIGGYIVSGSGNCTDTEIIIPSEYNGEPVLEIAEGAFYGNENITKIMIPSSIDTIYAYEFEESPNLTAIYCEATSKPSGWDADWNPRGINVVWGAVNSNNVFDVNDKLASIIARIEALEG